MIEVEKRSFITKEKYEQILEKLRTENVELKESKQITYYFSCEQDFRIMYTNDFTKMWLKKGEIHDDAREEMEVIIDNKYKEDLSKMLQALNYDIEIKWFRKRIECNYNDYYLTIDYSAGYGYIIEIEKQVIDENIVDKTKEDLEQMLISFDIKISSKEEFKDKYNDYKLNWKEYTKDINEQDFLKP